ncbi:MAG: SMC family ATPase [Proteobacteria bacterium]|nr:SMC family ATPase [Pseudomonadota bacterium]
MKPTHLVLEAFGPFPGRVAIDFDAIDDAMFLICGETGAGKTTVFDALAFALFGVGSGTDRGAADLRSDLAGPGAVTRVTLDFELAGRSYRIRRTPRQAGSAHKAELYDRTGHGEDGQHLVGGVSAVKARVSELLHLDGKQYRQTAILPQGEFRKVITGSSTEREAILRNLFDTEAHKALQDTLVEADKQAGKALAKADTEVETLRNVSGVGSSQDLAERLGSVDEQLKASGADLKTLRASCDLADTAVDEGRAASAALQALEVATAATQQLLGETTSRDADREALDRHDAAALVKPLVSDRDRRADEAHQARAQAELAAATGEEAERVAREAAAALVLEQGRSDERKALAERVHELQQVAAVGLAEAAEDHAKAVRAAKAASTAVDSTAVQHERFKAAHDAATESLEETQKRADILDEAELRMGVLDGRLETVGRRAEVQGAVAAAATSRGEVDERLRSRRVDYEAAQTEEARCLDRYVAGLAGTLAAALEDGAACQVCGSTEHPHKALGAPGGRREDLDAVRRQKARAHTALESVQREHAEAEKALAALEAQVSSLPEEKDPRGLRRDAQEASQTLADAKRASEAVEELLAARQEAFAALTRTIGELEGRRQTLQVAGLQLTQAATRLEERRARVPEELRGPGAIEAASAQAGARLEALETAFHEADKASDTAAEAVAAARAHRDDRLAQAQTASEHAGRADRELAQALNDAAFSDEAAWQEAQLADADRRRDALRLWDEALAEAKAVQRSAEQAAVGLVAPDLVLLEGRYEQAKEDFSSANRRHGELTNQRAAVATALAELRAAEQKLADRNQRRLATNRLAGAARGDNAHRLPFERYVLSSFLDEVLARANLRLQKMTGGRFTLHRSDEVDGRKRGGLDLAVEDLHSGTRRRAATLSGGEGFQAALSLALGLADTVQARSGGVHMDSLFIDEGFGSLGEEDLDRVLTTLEEMGAGRMIGLISHVRELRDRIPTRIEVVKSPTGSHIEHSA